MRQKGNFLIFENKPMKVVNPYIQPAKVEQEEEEDAIKFLKRPKYMAGPRESDEGEDSMADDVEIEADDLE